MNKTLIAITLSLILVMSFNSVYASSNPYRGTYPSNANISIHEDFDVRDTINHYGWHMSKVCGMEMCNGKTATENSVYLGMTVNGEKPPIKTPFNGHYYIKGNFFLRG